MTQELSGEMENNVVQKYKIAPNLSHKDIVVVNFLEKTFLAFNFLRHIMMMSLLSSSPPECQVQTKTKSLFKRSPATCGIK